MMSGGGKDQRYESCFAGQSLSPTIAYPVLLHFVVLTMLGDSSVGRNSDS